MTASASERVSCVHGTVNTAQVVNMLRRLFFV